MIIIRYYNQRRISKEKEEIEGKKEYEEIEGKKEYEEIEGVGCFNMHNLKFEQFDSDVV